MDAHQQERDAVDAHCTAGEVMESRIVACEYLRQRLCKNLCQKELQYTDGGDQRHALGEDVFQLVTVVSPVMETDNRRRAHAVANHNGHEHECQVHDNAVSGDTVFAYILHQLVVIEHRHDRAGDIGEELAHAVETGLAQRGPIEFESHEVQPRAVRGKEIDQGDQPAAHLREGCGPRRPFQPEAENTDQQYIQQHVQHSRDDGHPESEARFFRRHQQALEHDLKDEERQADEEDSPVHHAIAHHGFVGSEKAGDIVQQRPPDSCEQQAGEETDTHQHREDTVGCQGFPLPHCFGYQRATARAEHKAHDAEEHQKGKDQVEGSERGLTSEIRHEQAVHHAVHGGEDHHAHRGQGEPQEFPVGEMVGKPYRLEHRLKFRAAKVQNLILLQTCIP